MREIKFRFWQPFTKKMIYPKNGEGTFNDLQEKEDWKVMQYTGLKDKNGKEIYESDYLLCDGRTFEVKWHKEQGCWEYYLVSKNWSPKMYCNPRESEVIGNIYENRDLLK